MRAEYKRDVSHNYLILESQKRGRYRLLSGPYAGGKRDPCDSALQAAES